MNILDDLDNTIDELYVSIIRLHDNNKQYKKELCDSHTEFAIYKNIYSLDTCVVYPAGKTNEVGRENEKKIISSKKNKSEKNKNIAQKSKKTEPMHILEEITKIKQLQKKEKYIKLENIKKKEKRKKNEQIKMNEQKNIFNRIKKN